MTLQENIKQLPVEDKAAILLELQEHIELLTYLRAKEKEEWLRQQLSLREGEIKNGNAILTSRDHLNKRLAEKYEF